MLIIKTNTSKVFPLEGLTKQREQRVDRFFSFYLLCQKCKQQSLCIDGGVLLIERYVGSLGVLCGHALAAQPGLVFGRTLRIGGLLDVHVAGVDLLIEAVELQIDLWWGLAAEGLGLFANRLELQSNKTFLD